MQEPGRRPAPPFAGVDLRRPKGYPAAPAAKQEEEDEEEPAPAPVPVPAGDSCPRCGSRDTKFCYYNNYNTSQPRHFCKSCRRYWTKGGSLRNVPVGGGTRKSGASSSSAAASPGAAAPKNTKRSSKSSKRRRVALSPDASTTAADAANTAPSTEAAAAAAAAATVVAASEKPAPATELAPAAVVATEKPPAPAPAPPADDGGFTATSAAPGIGLADVDGVKELVPDASHFEWPSGCDLGSFFGTSVFGDTDPALFLNLP